jgi:aromatic ring-cleaving dioxygenase
MGEAPIRALAEATSFHAHIYFDPGTEQGEALMLRAAIGERFAVTLGRVWDRPVGPHSRAMFQIAFAPSLFGSLVPWLMLNHGALSVLVHPNTTNMKRDHLLDALWIGPPLALDGEVLAEENEAELTGPPNTAPTRDP